MSETRMKLPKKTLLILLSLFISSFLVPTVLSYKLPLKQKSSIELNYTSFNESSTATVPIEFSGEVNEHSNFDLWFVLNGVWLGYRYVVFCNVTLQIDNYNITKNADLTVVKVLPEKIYRPFFVTVNTTFEVPLNSLNLNATINGTTSFNANYKFKIFQYEKIFQDKMTGTATILIDGVTVDEKLPLTATLLIIALSLILQFFYKKKSTNILFFT